MGADLNNGGHGGYSYGSVKLKTGDTIYISVGGSGIGLESAKTNIFDLKFAAKTPWNGGGVHFNPIQGGGAPSGGGATSIQSSLKGDGQLKNYESVKDTDVLIVAGGGGAGEWKNLTGGVAGGLIAPGIKPYDSKNNSYLSSAEDIVTGGTQISGGHSLTKEEYTKVYNNPNSSSLASENVHDGAFGQGGYDDGGDGGGQGGGGWYGGGANNYAGGGAGGSGHIGTMLTDGQTIAGNQTFKSSSGTDETGHTGNGYARITDVTSIYVDINNRVSSSASGNSYLYYGGSTTDLEGSIKFASFDLYSNDVKETRVDGDWCIVYPANTVITINNIKSLDSRIEYNGPVEIMHTVLNGNWELKWNWTLYPIIYDLQGGTITNAPTNYDYVTARDIPNPTRPGFVFTGWTGWNGTTPQKDVKIPLHYPTSNGADGTVSLKANWEPSTYTVTIPTAISYTDMNIGKVDQAATYDVNVKGNIGVNDKVTVTADKNTTLVGDGINQITATTTQSKSDWTADAVSGNGTNSTDTIKLSGMVKTIDKFNGKVKYTSRLN